MQQLYPNIVQSNTYTDIDWTDTDIDWTDFGVKSNISRQYFKTNISIFQPLYFCGLFNTSK